MIVTIGGGYDVINGGPQWDNVWMDTTDTMTDTSAGEIGEQVHPQGQPVRRLQLQRRGHVDPGGQGAGWAEPADPEAEEGILWSHDFSDKPLFASSGPNADDVFQGSTGDCYMMARLSAIADANPEFIRKMVVDLGDGTYAVRFYRNGQPEYVRVDADLYWDPVSGKPIYAKLGRQESIWVPIVEKAYAFWRYQQGSYESISGGDGTTHEHLGPHPEGQGAGRAGERPEGDRLGGRREAGRLDQDLHPGRGQELPELDQGRAAGRERDRRSAGGRA